MIDETNIISENLAFYKSRKTDCNNAEKLWVTLLIKNAAKNGDISFAEVSKILKNADALSVSHVLTAYRVLNVKNSGELHSDISFSAPQKRPYIVSNFVNNLSEQTYYKLFGDKDYKIISRDNFIELFEDVYNERSNFCIVPIENTISGKLLNFYSLIINYNLKIVKVCDIEHENQDASTRFALVTNGPVHILSDYKNNHFFEISISANGNDCIQRVLEAASICKMHPNRINSIPSAHLRNEYSSNIIFKLASDASVTDFLGFLSLSGISFTPIGIFDCYE